MPRTIYKQGPNEPPQNETERDLRTIAERHHLRDQYRLFAAPFTVLHPSNMPRTIYTQGPNEPPQNESERDLRNTAERIHLRRQHRLFVAPFTVLDPTLRSSSPPPPPTINYADRKVLWEAIENNTRISKTLAQMTAEDCRYFCFKDCALYLVGAGRACNSWRMRIYETIYRRWFANRAEDCDISHGSFFCRPVDFQAARAATEPVALGEVLGFHEMLCGKLREAVEEMPEEVPRQRWQPIERSLCLPPAKYAVRETFERCFVVMRGERGDHELLPEVTRERGVLVVLMSGEDAEKHGCLGNELEKGVREVTDEHEDVGEARVFRCDSVDLAMKVVLASDPKRNGREPEWHGAYEEVLDPEDTTPVCFPQWIPAGSGRRPEGPVHEPRFF